jgi:hypothetical protein
MPDRFTTVHRAPIILAAALAIASTRPRRRSGWRGACLAPNSGGIRRRGSCRPGLTVRPAQSRQSPASASARKSGREMLSLRISVDDPKRTPEAQIVAKCPAYRLGGWTYNRWHFRS